MRILLSNDDGIAAPGLLKLATALATIADVHVMAPDRNRSGASNSLTLFHPLRVRTLSPGYYTVDGTPADCVHLALTGFFDPKPDLVVSGINDGANLGDDVLYSGTVAAAIEGRNFGLPAIAISMLGDQHLDSGVKIAIDLIQAMGKAYFLADSILNVNIPDLPLHQIQGLEVTRLGKRHAAEPMIKDRDPRGGDLYWVGPPGPGADAGLGTDFFAIQRGFVSVTPLHLDMTHYQLFDALSRWTETVTLPQVTMSD